MTTLTFVFYTFERIKKKIFNPEFHCVLIVNIVLSLFKLANNVYTKM